MSGIIFERVSMSEVSPFIKKKLVDLYYLLLTLSLGIGKV